MPITPHRAPAPPRGPAVAVCRACGTAAEVACATPCLAAPVVPGFLVEGVEIVLRGLCPACAERRRGGA